MREARARGHAAAQSAAERADQHVDDWTPRALQMLVAFARDARGDFLIEDARAYAEARDLPAPTDERAWGHVAQRAKRAGLIEPVGFAASRSSNGSPKTLWRRVPRQGEQMELAA